MSVEADSSRPPGRPIDPTIESRVYAAAIEVYSEVGWAGFTFGAVAVRAGVGKAAIYRRWESKADILMSAMYAANSETVEMPDTGSIRGDLLALADALLGRLDGPTGIAEIRLMMDTKQFADAFPDLDESRSRSRFIMREGVDRAVARGELPAGTRPELLFDAIRGTIIHNYLFVPRAKMAVWRDRRAAIAQQVVDVVLGGINALPGDEG